MIRLGILGEFPSEDTMAGSYQLDRIGLIVWIVSAVLYQLNHIGWIISTGLYWYHCWSWFF